MFASIVDVGWGCAAGLDARGALCLTTRLAGRLAGFFVDGRSLRADAARRDALCRERFELRDIFRLLLRDVAAVFAVLRRFLAIARSSV